MLSKYLSLAALAATASAQSMMDLNSTLSGNSNLTNLTSYLNLLGIESQLANMKNVTLLAPSNQAFATFMNSSMAASLKANDTAAIQALLMYHVLNGTYNSSAIKTMPSFIPTMLSNKAYSNVTGGQRVEAMMSGQNVTFVSGLLTHSNVTQANINFTGGIIHVIDTVLTPPQNISTTALAAGLTSVYGALANTSLVGPVDIASDLTVFVPSNAAFQAIGSALSNLSMAQLTGILDYHVVNLTGSNGAVGYSSNLMNGTKLTAMNGETLTISMSNGTVFVNSAKVVNPDVLVSNGVVHVIDAVLNPSNTTATANPTATMTDIAFAGASSASNAPFTSGVTAPSSAIGGGAIGGGSPTAAGGAASTTKKGEAGPMRTGAVGAAALFAAGAGFMNV